MDQTFNKSGKGVEYWKLLEQHFKMLSKQDFNLVSNIGATKNWDDVAFWDNRLFVMCTLLAEDPTKKIMIFGQDGVL